MLPSVLARQLAKGLSDYIATTFPMTNGPFKGSLTGMTQGKGYLYHEPYVSVRLPFRSAAAMPTCFQAVKPSYLPYVHQEKAFARLCGKAPRSTLIATGTGSGKTECFLYPILDYCYEAYRGGEKGIKALIIYPMNALATDQAKRIMALINGNEKLHHHVTCGMYIGGKAAKADGAQPGDDLLMVDREMMRDNPPDILLTNYKMLDYLLVRPADSKLWQHNGPDTLKFVAVDEFHTFDGAQGTDLACLLRRLKKRLGTPEGHLCCIGTSATMGEKARSERILSYASEVFGEPFEEDAIITEDRLTAEQFLRGYDRTYFNVPTATEAEALEAAILASDRKAYMAQAISAWLPSFLEDVETKEGCIALGKALMHLSFFHSLIREIHGGYGQVSDWLIRLRMEYPELPEKEAGVVLIESLLALISTARNPAGRSFLDVNVQLWLRELRRLEAKVASHDVTYAIAHDLNGEQAAHYLPVVNCRDCGATGWATLPSSEEDGCNGALGEHLEPFYNHFFHGDEEILLLYPHEEEVERPSYMIEAAVCPSCLHIKRMAGKETKCSMCGEEMIPVWIPDLKQYGKDFIKGSASHPQFSCPFCGSDRGVALMGLRSATEISTEISQLFVSPFNDDKLLLAFSDNVQDAAQRAGFFNARTWRFGLRAAIEQYRSHGGEGKCLADFMDGFLSYWHGLLSDEDFVSRFIAPNMIWRRAYKHMIEQRSLLRDKNGQLERDERVLMEQIEKRLRYEMLQEFGLGSRIGRTLEKSGCCALAFSAELLQKAASLLPEKMKAKEGFEPLLSVMDEKMQEEMVIRYVNTMRLHGAFYDESLFHTFWSKRGAPYYLSNAYDRCLPGRQTGRNMPRFLAHLTSYDKQKFYFDRLENDAKYRAALASCIEDEALGKALADRLSSAVMDSLVDAGLVKIYHGDTMDVYGLSMEGMYIRKGAAQMVCSSCGNVYPVSTDNSRGWEDSPCLRKGCHGTLHVKDGEGLDYYGRLFSCGHMDRVNAREHTGLLERAKREALEKDFKRKSAERRPWDPNVLSCTPTLEMGIDIGDLDTVALCSIPPTQASFLQRVGRAGRKDGNALVLAVANARPHDLYFYGDPMEMISGYGTPPKIFLNASAVLKRQLIAFCMDTWVKTLTDESAIPKNVGACLLLEGKKTNHFFENILAEKEKAKFPFNFLYYVQNHMTELLSDFQGLFKNELGKDTIRELEIFAKGDGSEEKIPFQFAILRKFQQLKKEEDALRKHLKELTDYKKELAAKPADSSLDEEKEKTDNEIRALNHLIKDLKERDLFGFLSDEGLLPNYAFPEEGIVLEAIFLRKERTEEEKKTKQTKKVTASYSRSASAAIDELAPDNVFYADGYKMTIDQLDVKSAEPQTWRLCPNCSHAEPLAASAGSRVCPSCGDPAWGELEQQVTLLKPEIVFSHVDEEKNLIGDDSEVRNGKFFFRQLLVDVDEKDVEKAYEMDNPAFPFGYEFVKKAVLREINFGEQDIQGKTLSVDGQEAVRKGFTICKYCGMVQNSAREEKHSYGCIARRHPESEEARNPFLHGMYLYREFQTEVLRVLIPATTEDTDQVRTESFAAAFMLGMKEYFGNVDHLAATVSKIPCEGSAYRKQYLVVYDSIPGGTGYLKQLVENESLMATIFQKALEVMERCSCREDPEKDGCYRCLYAYRQSRNIGSISRRAAMGMIRSILSGRDQLREIEHIGQIETNTIFDSELEQRFVEALRRMRSDTDDVRVDRQLINDKEGYLLHVNGSVWTIEPQVHLGPADGVAIDSKPDFILRLEKEPDGASAQIPRKAIAIFTDGFSFHKEKVHADTAKRNAIRRGGDYRVWSLSYQDVQDVFQKQGHYATKTLTGAATPNGMKAYKSMIEKLDVKAISPSTMSAFGLLFAYLSLPDAERLFRGQAQAYALSLISKFSERDRMDYAQWKDIWQLCNASADFTDIDFLHGSTLFGEWKPAAQGIEQLLSIYAAILHTDVKTTGVADVCAVFDDMVPAKDKAYEMEWNGFLQFSNLMQFLPRFMSLSKRGIQEGSYNSLLPVMSSCEIKTVVSDEWKDDLEMIFDENAKAIAEKAMRLGCPPPDLLGEEISDASGRVQGELEFGWSDRKVGYVTEENEKVKGYLLKDGWMLIKRIDEVSDLLGGHA